MVKGKSALLSFSIEEPETAWAGHLNGFCILVCGVAVCALAYAELYMPASGATVFVRRCLIGLCGTLLVCRLRRMSVALIYELIIGWIYRSVLCLVFSIFVVLPLAVIIWPSHFHFENRKSHSPGTHFYLRQIGLALSEYRRDHNDRLPPMPNRVVLQRALVPYGVDHWHSIEKEGDTPFWVNTAIDGMTTGELGEEWDGPFAWANYLDASGLGRSGRLVCFLNGGVRFIPEQEWRRIRPRVGQYSMKNRRLQQALQPASQSIQP